MVTIIMFHTNNDMSWTGRTGSISFLNFSWLEMIHAEVQVVDRK